MAKSSSGDSQPAVSIGMPAYNSAAAVARTITSLVNQSFRKWELLVIDDGSHDSTFEICTSFRDERIRVIKEGENRGLSARLNQTVDLARGKYFARMDADDIAYPSRLEKQIDFLEHNPDVDLLGTWVTVFRSDGELLGARRPPETHDRLCARPWRSIPLPHPTWMGRIGWFQANRYSERAIRMEDRELLLRTHRNSRFAVLPEILLAYREDPRSFTKILKARRNTCKMAMRIAVEQKTFTVPVLMIAGQCARALMEVIALPTGLDYKLLRDRTEGTSEEESRAFRELWLATSDNRDPLGAGMEQVGG
jgi:glycosyltransferase involved in cell wall biosynthesis